MTKPEKTLTLVFLRQDNKLLLAMKKRGFGAGRWNGVGGKQEVGETIEQAMVRETQEEIGVTPVRYKQVATIRFDEFVKGVPTMMNVFVFVADVWEGEPTESEEMRPRWFDVKDIPYEDMWPDDPYWLPQVLDGNIIDAEFTLDQNDSIISRSVRTVATTNL